ncbi:50S ribosomal protein L1 [Candidatus Woesearchaeota archaeon]|jgi:large subunit ribosomal protein L1|nr:50S ribosomal protein L1 [Candidatus Woesearchaeota archaeon]MBT5215719.1 50S ribosomal protein L1 [Candidatus Woesearchaeota archaeon]MBT6402014.1 50S ribosomal protein L1 [Candidatus Woesearchaeota archaeon]
MNNKEIIQAIKEARENAKERKFTESLDLVINLKGLNLKKEDEKILAFIPLPHQRGKKVKVTALIDQALVTKAKADCDEHALLEDFKKLDKKAIKKLAKRTDYFVAQANIMPKVAQTFGRVLGPRGMMPNPKAGCVVPPTADLKPLVARLQNLVRIETKNEQTIKTSIGSLALKDEELAANATAIYEYVVHHVPQEKNNIKNILVKTSMGKPVIVGEKARSKK